MVFGQGWLHICTCAKDHMQWRKCLSLKYHQSQRSEIQYSDTIFFFPNYTANSYDKSMRVIPALCGVNKAADVATQKLYKPRAACMIVFMLYLQVSIPYTDLIY